jgi:hypothetical protein
MASVLAKSERRALFETGCTPAYIGYSALAIPEGFQVNILGQVGPPMGSALPEFGSQVRWNDREISRQRLESEAAMESAAIKSYISPEEYLATERKAEFKSEYFDGSVYAMAGASAEHGLLTLDLSTALNSLLRSGPCQVMGPDLRVLVHPSGLYTYPDIVAVC